MTRVTSSFGRIGGWWPGLLSVRDRPSSRISGTLTETNVRIHPSLLAATVVALFSDASFAVEPFTIDRSLRREPVYEAKPRYCLLVFGRDAKTRVWLVTSGEAFYADSNGDGDLTEPGKRIYAVGNYRSLIFLDPGTTTMWLPAPENERIYQVSDIFNRASRTWYNITVRRSGKLRTAVFEILVEVKGKYRQLGRLPGFGDNRQNAPVLHFDGPLTLGLFTERLVRADAGNQMESWIGTSAPPGESGEPTYLIHDDDVPSSVFPVARMEFSDQAGEGKPIDRTVLLHHRERLVRFSGWLRVPDEVAVGKAKVTLSAGGWKWGAPRSATIEIPVVERGTSAEADKKNR